MRNATPSLSAGCHHHNGLFTITFFTLLLALALASIPTRSEAAFEFNFNKHSSVGWTDNPPDETQENCGGFGGWGNAECDFDSGNGTPDGDGNNPNYTRFRKEVVVDGGQEYWHMVVHNTDNSFRQEVYIRMGTRWSYIANSEPGNTFDRNSTSFSDSGGFPSGLEGQNGAEPNDHYACETYMGLGCDPLGKNASVSDHQGDNTWTGNGTGNPTRAVFRQVITDAAQGFTQEVYKPTLNDKHRITQTLNNGGMLSEFEADMRNSTYADMNSPLTVSSTMGAGPGNFVNKLTFTPTVDAEYGNNADFDMANLTTQGNATPATPDTSPGTVGIQAGKSTVTAGRHTFTAGGGWLAPGSNPRYYNTYYQGKPGVDPGDFYNNGNYPIYDRGTYTFAEGNFDQHAVDYFRYFRAAQNACGGDPFC